MCCPKVGYLLKEHSNWREEKRENDHQDFLERHDEFFA
jgi:hypothetical protein